MQKQGWIRRLGYIAAGRDAFFPPSGPHSTTCEAAPLAHAEVRASLSISSEGETSPPLPAWKGLPAHTSTCGPATRQRKPRTDRSLAHRQDRRGCLGPAGLKCALHTEVSPAGVRSRMPGPRSQPTTLWPLGMETQARTSGHRYVFSFFCLSLFFFFPKSPYWSVGSPSLCHMVHKRESGALNSQI